MKKQHNETNKSKGDLLEWVVFILERSFENTMTEIKRNHFIKDEHNIERELDIYVETNVNKKTLRYAFECKNYKKGVSLQHITDFSAKISNTGIKGYFVTTSNYQSGAVKKAKAIGIDLFVLKKREAENDDIAGLLLSKTNLKITSIDIVSKNDPGKLFDKKDQIQNCPKCSQRLLEIVNTDIIPYLQQACEKGIHTISPGKPFMQELTKNVGEKNARTLYLHVMYHDASITHKGNKLEYDRIIAGFKVWSELHKEEPVERSFYNYVCGFTEKVFASFSVSEFLSGDKNLIIGITKHNDGSRKMAQTDSYKTEPQLTEMTYIGQLTEEEMKSIVKNTNQGDEEC